MIGDVFYQSGGVLNLREVADQVEQVDLGLAHMQTAINWVPRFSVTVVKPYHVDRDVELLLDSWEVGRF